MKKLRPNLPENKALGPSRETEILHLYICNYLYFMTFQESASSHTLRSYQGDLGQAFGAPDGGFVAMTTVLEPLKESDVNSLLQHAKQALRNWATLSPASRNRKTATLKSFLGWLHREDLCNRDLAPLLHGPKVPSRLPRHLSVDETTALIRSIEIDTRSAEPQDARKARLTLALISLLYGGGLRISEACELRIRNLQLRDGTCRVLGKGAKERVIALPPIAANAIRSWLQTEPETTSREFVFGEEPLSARKAYDLIKDAGKRAKLLKPLNPHALRHSYATHLLRSGANLRVLQTLLGHASLQATSRYTHVGLDQLARTLESHHPLGDPSKKKRTI